MIETHVRTRDLVIDGEVDVAEVLRGIELPAMSIYPSTALAELMTESRPFRLGLAQIRVGNDAYKLDVSVTPDKATYPVRGKARVVHPILWVTAALFVLYFAIDPVRELLGAG